MFRLREGRKGLSRGGWQPADAAHFAGIARFATMTAKEYLFLAGSSHLICTHRAFISAKFERFRDRTGRFAAQAAFGVGDDIKAQQLCCLFWI
jgi:hypothetical protein